MILTNGYADAGLRGQLKKVPNGNKITGTWMYGYPKGSLTYKRKLS